MTNDKTAIPWYHHSSLCLNPHPSAHTTLGAPVNYPGRGL